MKSIKKVPRRWLSVGLTLGLLAIVCLVSKAVAQEPDDGALLTPASGSPINAMTYQGYLQDNGQPANGLYDFRIDVWNAETGGTQLGPTQVYDSPGIMVEDGIFSLYFSPGSAQQVFTGSGRWLRLRVRPHGVGSYTTLPRQPVTNAPYAWSLKPGAIISGTVQYGDFGEAVLNIDARHPWGGGPSAIALYARSSTSSAVRGESGGIGVYGSSTTTWAVYGESTNGTAGRFDSEGGHGVWGSTTSTDDDHHGGYFTATQGDGVYAQSTGGDGVYGTSETSYGIHGEVGGYQTAVYGHNTSNAGGIGVWGSNAGDGPGISGTSSNGAGVYGYSSSGQALRGVSTSGNLIELYRVSTTAGNREFYISNDGEVYADGGYHCGKSTGCWYTNDPADFAEVLPTINDPEPGDVLAITPDGQLTQSTEPYQTNVLGVYSTRPMYIGGGENLEQDGYAPLAMMGIVPVKASAENGPIVPGDLLTTSSTAGHAMKADHFVGGTIIGKALEGLGEDTGVIQMLVMLQ